MKLRVLIHITILLMVNQANAQAIEIRSGEHDTFSRIVLSIPVGTDWALTRTGSLAELFIDLPAIRFDTSQVFNRIPKSRLLRVSQRQPGEALRLDIGCECKVTGFTQSGTLLVIDIQDPEKPNVSSLQISKAAPRFWLRNFASMKTHKPKLTWDLEPESTRKLTIPILANNLKISKNVEIFTNETISITNTSELRLLSQIDRAAEQGLLLRNAHISQTRGTKTTEIGDKNDSPLPVEKMQSPSRVSIISTSSMEQGLAGFIDLEQQIVAQMFSCMSANLVALPDWGNASSFGTQVGNRRSFLFGEFDTIDQHALIDLTRNLLFFGFGAEAKRTLDLFTGDKQTRELLSALAEIMDNGRALIRDPFLGQQVCNSDVALWAYLAVPNVGEIGTVNSSAILTAFSRLPGHLRVLLGPNLADRFSISQDMQSADFVLRTANRPLARSDPALDLARANVNMLHKNLKAASNQMDLIAQSGTDMTPQALIGLVEAKIVTGQTISPHIPDLIATYLAEFRKTDLAPKLHRAHVLALALVGRFTDAFHAYRKKIRVHNETSDDEILSQLLTILVNRADEIVFLNNILAQIEHSEATFSVELQHSLATRLIDLGFSESASEVLMWSDEGLGTSDRRIMNAQIAIFKDLPNRALVELFGIRDPLAVDLRTKALLTIGEYENAGFILKSSGADPSRAFWHAENWDAISHQDNPLFLEASILAKSLQSANQKTESQGSLAFAQVLAESSSVTRSNIRDLLLLVGRTP